MLFTLANVVLALLILEVFFFLAAITIREIAVYIFKIKDHTLHKSAEVAAVLTVLVLAQFLIAKSNLLKGIILIIMIFVLFYMIRRTYELDVKKALLMSLCFIVIWAILLAVLAYVFVRFS